MFYARFVSPNEAIYVNLLIQPVSVGVAMCCCLCGLDRALGLGMRSLDLGKPHLVGGLGCPRLMNLLELRRSLFYDAIKSLLVWLDDDNQGEIVDESAEWCFVFRALLRY